LISTGPARIFKYRKDMGDMMQKQCSAATRFAVISCVLASTCGLARAADLAETKWTGPYAGVNAGALWGSPHASTTVLQSIDSYFGPDDFPNVASAGSQSLTAHEFTGGAAVGYNWQVRGLVFGIETGVNAQHVRGAFQSVRTPSAYLPTDYTIRSSVENDWLWTLRPRLGLTSGPWMVYVSGGVAVGNVRAAWLYDSPQQGAREHGEVSGIRTGWVAGAGVELALSNQWSIKTELLRVDLGSVAVTSNNVAYTNGATFPLTTVRHSVDFQENLMTVGLNYRF
jgi:outer membrane immunogenic protein